MKEICNKNKCFGCMACMNVCPKKCIKAEDDSNGFAYPVVDEDKCINCNRCVKVCPANAQPNLTMPTKVLAGQLQEKSLAMKSTSGGLFQALAKEMLKKGGVVCAARQNEDFGLQHVVVSTEEELERCLRSKYYQSNIGNVFQVVRKYLRDGVKVLFCGTPCQVAGLQSFLDKPYDNLITCDLICHGVPSRKVVCRYISDKEKQYGSTLKEMLFRDKSKGWDKMRITLSFENGKTYTNTASHDPFYFGFFRGLYYRKSCYQCPYAQEKRIADLTLGDFWGIEYTMSKMDSEKGISLILVNTEKGLEYIGKTEGIVLENHTLGEAVRLNHNLKNPSKMNPKQDYFYSLLDSHSLAYSLFRSLPLRYIKSLIKKYI